MNDKSNLQQNDSQAVFPSLGRAAVIGMFWTLASSSVAKLASLLSQFVLGWLLSASDFGLYALAISAAAVVDGLLNGGTERILIQRGAEYPKLAGPVFRIALFFNLLAATVLLLIAPLAAHVFDAPELLLLMALIALPIPLNTPTVIMQAKLTIDLEFKFLSKVDALSALIRHGSIVIFAILGFGPLSFVLPLTVVAVYEIVAVARRTKLWPRATVPARLVAGGILRDARWVMIGTMAGVLHLRAHYLVIGLLEGQTVVGFYFFAFQLSLTSALLLVSGLHTVMLGTFVKVSDPLLQGRGYLKAINMLSLFAVPASAVMILLTPPLITLLWSGKWDVTIPVVQILMVGFLPQLLKIITNTFIEAQGRWRLRAAQAYAYVAGQTVCVAIGAWSGGLISIAMWLTAFEVIFSLSMCAMAGARAQLVPSDILEGLWPPVVLGMVSFFASHYAVQLFVPVQAGFITAGAQTAFFILSFWICTWGTLRSRYRDALSVLLPSYRRGAVEP